MKKLGYIFILFLFAAQANAQLLFTASADKYKVGVGETFTVTFRINTNDGKFRYPNFDNFSVVAGPMTSYSNSIINGVQSSEKAVSFDLMALKTGEFTIGPAGVIIKEKALKTKPLKITVVEGGQNKSGSLEDKASDLAEVRILTNKRKVYVGEPISARYVLYLKASVSNFEFLEQPDFQGFLKNDIELKQLTPKQENVDGQEITTVDISKFVLIPQQAGSFNLGKLSLRLPTQVPTGRRDWFNRPEVTVVNQISSSRFPKLEVLALPKTGKPADFSGGVGSYRLDVNLSRDEVKGNESITLTIEVAGKGNIQLIELPEPNIPSSIETYDPKYKERIDVLPTGVKGFKRHEILLIPRYKGTYKIPPIKFAYFDSDLEKYVTLSSEELTISVTEGEEAKTTPGGGNTVNRDKNAVSALGEDILFIHTNPSEFEKEGDSFYKSTVHWLFMIGLVIVTFLLFVWKRLSKNYNPDVAAQVRKKAGSAAKKQLKSAHQKLEQNDIKGFYGELATALQQYFKNKNNLAPADFSIERVAAIILKKGGNDGLTENIRHLINQANMARFAPLTEANMKSDYELAVASLEKLEELR